MSALAEALVAAQAELPAAIPRDAEGEGYRYVTLDALLEVVRPILNRHGIALSQWPSYATLYATDKNPAQIRPMLITRLEHVASEHTGGWIEYTMPLYVTGNDMQGFGSAITYARRYALQAALGIAAETDDDGRAASGKDVPF